MDIGVLCLFSVVLWVALRCVIVLLPGYSHMLFNVGIKSDQPHILQSVASYALMQHICFLKHLKVTHLSLNSIHSIRLL